MKNIYFFGGGKAEGSAKNSELLGGKGANLSEMTNLGIPVPPGFTISTEVCNYYLQNKSLPKGLKRAVKLAIKKTERIMGQVFGCVKNPLLFSVRSGARTSMPGMMETVLNIGLTSETIQGLIKQTNDKKFAYDVYRRLITMYSDVVMEKGVALNNNENNIRLLFEEELELLKNKKKIKKDSDLNANDLQKLCLDYKEIITKKMKQEFPDDPTEQLWSSIIAVFKSWNGKRAVSYREIENIPHAWGTAVNVQAMVFGNMGKDSATGVAFTRNPATGENNFYGEWLPNAQGEDVVAGIRTPNPLNKQSNSLTTKNIRPSLENSMPNIYSNLNSIQKQLEYHYKDMQDIEFTIQKNKLWMLQTRKGKRNGAAAIKIAMDMVVEGLIDEKEAINRINASQLDEIMHPTLDTDKENKSKCIANGLPAGPGGAYGQIVFSADEAERRKKEGKKVILVRNETSPEDIHGMFAAVAILTSRGGMTSHAALVARGWGKCCVVGCSEINISIKEKKVTINNKVYNEGDWLTINGSSGKIYSGKIPLKEVNLEQNTYFNKLMQITDFHKKLDVRTNADSPKDANKAKKFGAKGIGLCRTEHMFFNPNRIAAMREMIVAPNESKRRNALMKLLPYQQQDFYDILKAMAPHPVTIRLLDPPLHEFLPTTKQQIIQTAKQLNISTSELQHRINDLHEINPMLGHRGCRLGISYPEITEMQTMAILYATKQLLIDGVKVVPEIMIPLVGSVEEYKHQKNIIISIADEIQKKSDVELKFLIGTMIELPRACMVAGEIAKEADFISFGTNDLTQTAFGFSRDDIGSFLTNYLDSQVLRNDPFQTIDIKGVGELVRLAVNKSRRTNKSIKIGVCGEHGGDPVSIQFFNEIGLDYISCSPFRVPIARLAAAKSNILS